MLNARGRALFCGWLLSALGACASKREPEEPPDDSRSIINSWVLFSAYDGVHEYSVTPNVPEIEGSSSLDPIMASTLRWEHDGAFVERSEFPELPGSIKLTTKQAGETIIKATGTTLQGIVVSSKLKLLIGDAHADLQAWTAADERYGNGEIVSPRWWTDFPPTALEGEGTCGLPYIIDIPPTAACVSCHNESDAAAAEYTPTQTAEYPDYELLEIVTNARKFGDTFRDPRLQAMNLPDCIFASFHMWDLTPLEARGMVWRLRAIPPRVIP